MAIDRSISILLVDNSATIIHIIRSLLRHLGFNKVDEAGDAAAVLVKMRTKSFGLVISDWNMESMSGYDLLREVKADPALKQTRLAL